MICQMEDLGGNRKLYEVNKVFDVLNRRRKVVTQDANFNGFIVVVNLQEIKFYQQLMIFSLVLFSRPSRVNVVS